MIRSLPTAYSNDDEFRRRVAETVNAAIQALVPTGALAPYAGSSAPYGWLLCDGSAVSRTTYAGLFGVIGTIYGAGDGSTTFNLPNLTGRYVKGGAPGTSAGANSVTLTQANLPNVNFTVTDAGHSHGVTDAGHSHAASTGNFVLGTDGSGAALGTLTASASGEVVSIDDIQGQAPRTATQATGVSVNSATTGITVASGGSGAAVSTDPAHVTAYWIVKV